MSEFGEYVGEEGRPLGDPTPPLVPLDAAPGSSSHHEPLDLGLLDKVDDGVQCLAVTPSPKLKRLRHIWSFSATASPSRGGISKLLFLIKTDFSLYNNQYIYI